MITFILNVARKWLHKITPRSSEAELSNEPITKSRNQKDEYCIEHCLCIKHQRQSLRVHWVSVIVTFSAVVVAIFGPWIQELVNRKSSLNRELVNLYNSISFNQKLFSDQFNERNKISSYENLSAPLYIHSILTPYAQDILQKKIGIVNFQFLNFYLDRTNLLNSLIDKLREQAVTSGLDSQEFINKKDFYIKLIENMEREGTIESLERAGLVIKFNFIKDPSCLKEIFLKSFDFLKPDTNESNPTCSAGSLNRIFYYFGDLTDTPEWQKPRFKEALKE